MTTLLLQHSVDSYEVWKPLFDGHEANRRQHGATGHRVIRDGNAITALIDFPDRSSAQSFVEDPALLAAMAQAGVQGAPTIAFADDVEAVSY